MIFIISIVVVAIMIFTGIVLTIIYLPKNKLKQFSPNPSPQPSGLVSDQCNKPACPNSQKRKMEKINLVIFSGASKPVFYDKIKKELIYIADNLDKCKYNVWYGGGESGLMGIIPSHFDKKDGCVYSINAKQFVDIFGVDSFSTTYVMDTFNERQNNLIEKGDIFLCLPGGVGTISELFDVLTDNDINNENIIILIYSYNNFYKDIIHFLNIKIKEGLIKENIFDNLKVFKNSKDIINFLKNYKK